MRSCENLNDRMRVMVVVRATLLWRRQLSISPRSVVKDACSVMAVVVEIFQA